LKKQRSVNICGIFAKKTAFEHIKIEENAEMFCSFLIHIENEHHREVFDRFYESGEKFDAMEWAVVDTVRWKFQSKNEDDHDAVTFFLDKFVYWSKYLQRHEEL